MSSKGIRFYYVDTNGEETYARKELDYADYADAKAFVKEFLKDEFLDFGDFLLNKSCVVTVFID